ncbi:hypothetical protein [Streptomyces aurantiogriseus]|uniref:DUF3592 domain-containing protein n=1 Tax=Streptomyces aurantiogriseus TaxID=66870 RepID=A0A918FL62_9ACTN|nr:hypothetical protein [Streptomyces aurantiogriseus]GGR50466.1 hypothetical protein GCM10010251_79220 [Streptomyces aurantiogriseus]
MPRRSEPSPSPLPSITLRGHGESIWLEARAVWLQQKGTRRRIPIAAVEGARVTGRGGRSVEVALWGSDGAPGPVFVVEGRDASAAARLVEVINRERSETAPPQGGTPLVDVLPTGTSEAVRRRKRRTGAETFAVLAVYLGGIAGLALAGRPFQALLWAAGVMPLALGLLLVGPAAVAARQRWVLRKQGVAVVALFAHGNGQRKYFRYTDLEGGVHEIRADYAAPGIGGDPQRIEVVYDPEDPNKAVCTLAVRTLVWRTAGVVLFGVPVLLLGVGMTVGQAVSLFF